MKFPHMLDIFQFEGKKKKFVLDINTSAFFEVSDLTGDLLKIASKYNTQEVVELLRKKYSQEDIEEAFRDFENYNQKGLLLDVDRHPPAKYTPYRRSDVAYLCMNLTHDCNLRCKYCYGDGGSYGGNRDSMTISMAQKTVDFLMNYSGNFRDVEINFFGGEPLMNFDVMKYTVLYANSQAEKKKKKVTYTVTTNATLMNKEVQDFLNEYNIWPQISLDGPPHVQDVVRPDEFGKGSYKAVAENVKRFVDSRGRATVRSTLNHYTGDLTELVKHFLNMGFTSIHVEPVSAFYGVDYALSTEDIRKLEMDYGRFADYYINLIKSGKRFNYEIFGSVFSMILHGEHKDYYCGAGRKYIAVTPRGELYPCHRFQTETELKMGDIFKGIDYSKQSVFMNNIVERAPKCKTCWARYLCGGGCYQENYIYNKQLNRPYSHHCFLRKLHIKTALEVYSSLQGQDGGMIERMYGKQ